MGTRLVANDCIPCSQMKLRYVGTCMHAQISVVGMRGLIGNVCISMQY